MKDHDLTHEMLATADTAWQQALEEEEAEAFLLDVSDVIARQSYYFHEAIAAGLPRDVAVLSAAQMAAGLAGRSGRMAC